MEIFFWVLVAIVFYTYFGYHIILWVLVKLKNTLSKQDSYKGKHELPEITLIVAAYNEKDYIKQKIWNGFSLNYPKEKLCHLWVTDGSNDGSPEILKKIDGLEVLHENTRKGKISAMNRAMKFVKTPIVVFSDCNTLLSENSLQIIAGLFMSPSTGCVSGEKRIFNKTEDNAAGSGENFYWRLESKLKKLESDFNTVVGAAGELFAIRTELFHEIPKDTILDDFVISMKIASLGYKIKYNPEASATESASENISEEMKRKIRIAAGAFQTMTRESQLFNIFRTPLLSFQFISHKVFRWLITPIALALIPFSALFIYISENGENYTFRTILYLICIFILLAVLGFLLKNKRFKIRLFFIPYYFFLMNFAQFQGLIRFLRKNQAVTWEKARRAA